jgi:hypothetical protein
MAQWRIGSAASPETPMGMSAHVDVALRFETKTAKLRTASCATTWMSSADFTG